MNLKSKLYIIKHSSSFTYCDFTSLSALHNMAAEQLHSLLIERSFLGHLFVRRQRTALRRMVQLRRFLGLTSKSYLAIAKDTA